MSGVSAGSTSSSEGMASPGETISSEGKIMTAAEGGPVGSAEDGTTSSVVSSPAGLALAISWRSSWVKRVVSGRASAR